jgi:Asp-tRNA(Asn)/Glu-tRNA(Gln) amidotransferase A subunit family amidase
MVLLWLLISKLDVPEATHGAPCSVQVIAPRFRDEECLRAMEIIDAVLEKDN